MAYLILPPEYLPQLQTAINWLMSFTPLISYGSTIIGIQRDKSSAGFSMDICCTMLIASVLRIFFFISDPFEISLLRQCFTMIFIQVILLRTALKFRSLEFDELDEYPSAVPDIIDRADKSVKYLQSKFDSLSGSSGIQEMVLNFFDFVFIAIREFVSCVGYILSCVFGRFLSFFNGIYKRPFKFWQWRSESTYWKFLLGFVAVVAVLEAIFWKNETFGMILGSCSFMVESSLPLPQILLFNRLKSVEGFRTILLLSWLGGDLTKISYLLYGTNNISTIFVIAAFFQMSLNLVITYQFFHYRKLGYPKAEANRQRSNSVRFHEDTELAQL
ncbi:unnamed protein product [Kuraishia capsulata CBS 1993]|uniref:PQ-loop repeat-containing protein 1 n=1 Tax=Kuraishia capsulata CBS 1993 TaxID=1382522 RepID=W6MIG3_9ASCO|nr:uncharacterized protein KUCA_T00001907001 [Kuraishia capsulata CBS 1993]CDK25936.1 unnamed protein product [Kuraishia capsulata CBS 1993]